MGLNPATPPGLPRARRPMPAWQETRMGPLQADQGSLVMGKGRGGETEAVGTAYSVAQPSLRDAPAQAQKSAMQCSPMQVRQPSEVASATQSARQFS